MSRAIRVAGILAGGLVLTAVLAGCLPADDTTTDAEGVTGFLLTAAEVPGWVVTPDEGSVDGSTPDCTGAPYDWPDLDTVSHASQFLDRSDESVAVVVKRVDGEANVNVEALRGALEPCTPESGERRYGAMIRAVGDDSFAYQSRGSDEFGDYVFSNMVVTCGDLSLEVLAYSYSSELDQAELESLVEPSVQRIVDAGGC